MDEHQITHRIEGARPDPGIATGPAHHMPIQPPRRRKWRLWMPIAILVLMGGLIWFIRFSGRFPGDEATTSMAGRAAYTLTGLLLAVWFIFFTGMRWRWRLLLAGLGVLAVVGLLVCFRIDGATGDMSFRWRFRWSAPADADLPGLAGDRTATGRDATIRPGDFPQFLGMDRNAVVHGVFLDRDWAGHAPRQLWRQKIGAGWSSFAAVGDLVVTLEQRGARELVVARDRNSGEPVWWHGDPVRFTDDQTRMGGDGPRSTPTVAAGKVFTHGGTGLLDCFDAASGKLLWSHDTLGESKEGNIQWGVSASPLVIEDLGLVVVSLGKGGPGGSLAAYDLQSGEQKWVAGQDMASYASPVLATFAGERQIVSINDRTVTGHDPKSGAVLWEYSWQQAPAKASQPPILPDDRLLLTAGYGVPGVVLHIKKDGDKWTTEEDWTTNKMRTKFTTPVVRDHYAYGLDDGDLACIDLDDEGKQVWKAGRADRFGHGQVLLVEDLLLVQQETPGDVVLVEASPKGFHKLGVLHVFDDKTWNNPALAGNRLYLRNDREAACYELATMAKVD